MICEKKVNRESIFIPLLRGGGVPNGQGGREHKAMKNSTVCIATTSPYGYSPLPPPPLSGESNLPGGGEVSYSVFFRKPILFDYKQAIGVYLFLGNGKKIPEFLYLPE